jgi:hypothetical protein
MFGWLAMWYPKRDFSLKEARLFLRRDFTKILKRNRHLYVQYRPPKSIGRGYFEPVLLCLCWCDFLGALYVGIGKKRSTDRSLAFIKGVLAKIKPGYEAAAKELVSVYRHGTVHAYAPAGPFDIRINDSAIHLTRSGNRLVISLDALTKDLIDATKSYSSAMSESDSELTRGSLAAFNKGRRELQKSE